MALLEVQRAGYSYSSHKVFQDISFSVGPGEIFCIFGPNGCGKTTLLECLLGSASLNDGAILLNGISINRMNERDIAKTMAYVPQNHLRSFPYTVEEVVMTGRSAHIDLFSTPSKADYKIVQEAMEIVGVSKLKDRPYTQLSGGEGQLVMLARALSQQAPLIIMDEPTCHLDFLNEVTMLEFIVRLVKDTGRSIIMATHSPNHAFYFENNAIVTRVALMNKKRFGVSGTPTAVLTEDNLKEIYQVTAKIVSYSTDTGLNLKQIVPISTLCKDEESSI